MSIQSEQDFVGLARIGRIVGLTLQEMEKQLEPGITTGQLDEIGERFLERHGARSAPRLFKNFPGANCISLNDEAVTVTLPPVSERKRRIAAVAETAFHRGCQAARAGRPTYEIGRAVEAEVRRG